MVNLLLPLIWVVFNRGVDPTLEIKVKILLSTMKEVAMEPSHGEKKNKNLYIRKNLKMFHFYDWLNIPWNYPQYQKF